MFKKRVFQNKTVRREFMICLSFKNLNYGGHNITHQNCLTTNFDDIIQVLFNCPFMAIESCITKQHIIELLKKKSDLTGSTLSPKKPPEQPPIG